MACFNCRNSAVYLGLGSTHPPATTAKYTVDGVEMLAPSLRTFNGSLNFDWSTLQSSTLSRQQATTEEG